MGASRKLRLKTNGKSNRSLLYPVRKFGISVCVLLSRIFRRSLKRAKVSGIPSEYSMFNDKNGLRTEAIN